MQKVCKMHSARVVSDVIGARKAETFLSGTRTNYNLLNRPLSCGTASLITLRKVFRSGVLKSGLVAFSRTLFQKDPFPAPRAARLVPAMLRANSQASWTKQECAVY